MKLGLVRRGYSPTGGAEAYLQRCATALRAEGHEAVLFASADWPAGAWAGERVTLPGGSPGEFARAFAKARSQVEVDAVFSLERVAACDVYRAGDGVHRAWLERRRAFEPAWRPWVRGLSAKHRELCALEEQLFRGGGARWVIANSELVKREIVTGFGFPEERIRVVYNGLPAPLDVTEEERAAVRARYGWGTETLVVLFAGSGWERKGLRFAVAGLEVARVPGAVLAVAGKGKRRGLGGAGVVFLGPVAQLELGPLLAAADVLVLPTIYDPFSNACLEALAAGLPVITTPANGFAEIMVPGADGTILSRPDAVEEIGAAIREFGAQRGDRARREARRERAAAWTIEQNIAETLAVLRVAARGD